MQRNLVAASLGILLLSQLGCGAPRPPGPYHAIPGHCKERSHPAARGTGLALSGGGYRATLFHAGALRRLNELGLLKRVDELSSVSGGSIASGQLAAFVAGIGGSLDRDIEAEEWNEGYAEPIRRITSTDIRTQPILRKLFLPWNWFATGFEVEQIADRLDELLGVRPLAELPVKPDFVFDATDLSFGASFEFRRWRMGSYKAGYLLPPSRSWTLGQAVASSAAFPPVIQPMPVDDAPAGFANYVVPNYDHAKPEWDQHRERLPEDCWKAGNWDYAMQRLELSDGGVYDNLGLEPIWKDRRVLFVSNAGGPFSNQPDGGFLKRVMRWSNIVDGQSRDVRKRWLMAMANEKRDSSEADGADKADRSERVRVVAYWGITASRSNYLGEGNDLPGYSAELAQDFISQVRTDLNVFSEAEQAILENHGYMLADASLKMISRELRRALGLSAGSWPEPDAPHAEWLPGSKTECQIKQALFPQTRCQH